MAKICSVVILNAPLRLENSVVVFYMISWPGVINIAEQDPKQEGEKFFTETSKSQMQSLIATGAVTVAILTTLSMGRNDAQQVFFED